LGDAQRDSGAPATAAATYSRAAEVGKSLAELAGGSLGALDRWFVALDRLGDARLDCLDPEGALDAHRQAAGVARRGVEVSNGSVDALSALGGSLFGIGYTALKCDKTDEAVSAYRECVEVQRPIVALEPSGTSHRTRLATALRYLCDAETRADHFDAARTAVEEALAILRGPIEDGEPAEVRAQLVASLIALARLEDAAGNLDPARKAYEGAIAEDMASLESGVGAPDAVRSLADSHLRRSSFELSARCGDAAREHARKGTDLLVRVVDELGEDWFCLDSQLEMLESLGDQYQDAGDTLASLQLRRDWVDLHRWVARRDAPGVETLEHLTSALRQLVMELDSAGATSEAAERRDELTLVEARLKRVKVGQLPADPVPT
jgi:tetratricopeptide (TPR) repeat protein